MARPRPLGGGIRRAPLLLEGAGRTATAAPRPREWTGTPRSFRLRAFDAVTMGDVDGDGMTDFLITSAWSGIHGFHSGRVFIVSSGVKRGG